MEGRDDEDDAELDDALEDDGDGHEGCAAAVEAWFFGACCEACAAGGSEGLDEGANVDEEVDGAVGVEPGEHGDVVHDAAENVVGGGREDRGSGVDEDSGRDVDVYIVWVVAGDGTQDPADGVNERAPEHPERHPPEAVAAVNVSKHDKKASGRLTSSGRYAWTGTGPARMQRQSGVHGLLGTRIYQFEGPL